ARPEVGKRSDELLRRRGGRLVEVDRGHGMLRDWGVCWLLAVFSIRDLSRQSMTLVGPMEDAGRQLTSLAAMCIALGHSRFVSASLLHDPKPAASRSPAGQPYDLFVSEAHPAACGAAVLNGPAAGHELSC